MANLAVDTFIRANQSGWGTASDGVNVWGSPINTTFGSASISSNEGIFSNGSGADSQIICGSHSSTTDINMLIRTETSDVNNLNGLLWRYTSASGGSGYRCGFFSGTTFNVDVYTAGSRSNLTSFSFSYSANTFYWIRLIHTAAGTLQIRVWADGSSEPGTWNVNQSETTYSSGDFGVSMFLSGATSGTFDSLTVTDNHAVVVVPTIKPRYITRGLLSTIIPDDVTQPLAYKERGIGGTIIYEIRTFIPRALGGTYIPETWRMMPRAFGARFVQSLDQFKDISTRFRLKSANQFKDISTRFILTSSTQSVRDIASRFRLKSADQLKDIASRFRLKSADQLKDIQSRFRLMSANQLKDIVTRFRLKSADQLKDITSRFRLKSADQQKDVASRFRLMSANQLKDIASRFRLKSADQLKDISTRFILASASQRIKDIASRFRLMSANQLKDIVSRFRLMSANQVKDVASRFRLKSANQLKDIQSRFRVMSANQLRDISTRLRLKSANQLRDIASRFILHGVGTLSNRDISTRFVLIVPSNAVWVTRDGLISWLTRDDKAAWDTRDDLATWKTR